MEIGLKNIQVCETLSRDSTAFEARLYVNGQRTGGVANDGNGGEMMYQPKDEWSADLIVEAKLWACRLPPVVCAETTTDGQPVTIPMDLDIYIDNLVTDWLRQKDLRIFRLKMEKEMLTAILFGIPGNTFRLMKYRVSIATLIGTRIGRDQLRRDIHSKVIPLLEGDEKILNTNIPAETVRFLDVPAAKWVDQ